VKITKFEHSCLLVEMPAPVNRTALFDPGVMSEQFLDVDKLVYLDDIFITHVHSDHVSVPLLKQLLAKFPAVRITSTDEVVSMLAAEGIKATTSLPAGVELFDSPHEKVTPLFPQPEEIGIHYLDKLTHPGDSHNFKETKAILALPMTGPWGNNVQAGELALDLKPQFVLPIHDWHWRPEARTQAYDSFMELLGKHDIIFVKLETGKPVVLNV
jgi:L-ascorbate metabolism protein UlaG (beta-lactamase superfamily)